MTNPLRTSILVVGLGACVASCGVAESDSSLWKQTKDYGGTQYQPNPGGPGPGASGSPAMGEGGAANIPPGQGGAPPGTGNTSSVGTGGFVGGGNGGSGQVFPGAGGFATGAGGFFPGAGGAMFGAGGFNVGAGGGSPGTGGMPITGNSGKCDFTFDVTTVTARGRYAPVNVGAVWISDAQNKFVKTLNWWGRIRLSNATAWTQATGSNKTDAVSGASRTGHGQLMPAPKWDCTDVSKNAVPDGAYVVHVTFAESDANPFFPGTPIQASVNFTKSSAPADVMGQDTANFTGMHVKLTPQ